MKKNKDEGFILVEAIVVAVFVLSLFTFLFVNVVPLVGRYESEEYYDTIDGTYGADLIRNLVLQSPKTATLGSIKSTNPYKKYNKSSFCDEVIDSTTVDEEHENQFNKNFCNTLLGEDFLNVKYIYVTMFRTNLIKEKSKDSSNSADFDKAEKAYISSLDNYSTTSYSSTVFNNYHRLIVEYENGEFANIELRS